MMKILVVDDHALFRAGLVSLFKSQPDFEVVGEASSVQEAVAVAQAVHPDLVIMDLGLPDGSGIEAMQKIHEHKANTMVVFLTIHASEERAFAALRHGAKGFLIKNIAAPKLLAALRGLNQGELAIPRAVLSRFVSETLHWVTPRSGNGFQVQEGLTPREMEVLGELTTGARNKAIARRLSISENTLKVHIHNILDKLKLSSRREAAELARRHGLAKHHPASGPDSVSDQPG